VPDHADSEVPIRAVVLSRKVAPCIGQVQSERLNENGSATESNDPESWQLVTLVQTPDRLHANPSKKPRHGMHVVGTTFARPGSMSEITPPHESLKDRHLNCDPLTGEIGASSRHRDRGRWGSRSRSGDRSYRWACRCRRRRNHWCACWRTCRKEHGRDHRSYF
jgi:hypothetical protein